MNARFRTLVDIFNYASSSFAERPVYGTKIAGAWRWTTYVELATLVDRFRAALARLGVGKGDRVAIIANNRLEWAVAAYATYGLEAAFVSMYEAQRSAERQFILRDSGAKVVIVANDAIQTDVAAMELPELVHIIGLERPASDGLSWTALLEAGSGAPVPARSPDPASVAAVVYTSGTTGKPKGVLLSHDNIVSTVNTLHEIFPLEPDDRSLSFLPWAHVYGQVAEVHWLMSIGSSAALNDEIANLLPNLAAVKPTILFAVPSIFNRIYEAVNQQIAQRPGFIQRMIRTGIQGAIKRARGERLGALERVELALDQRLVFTKIRDRLGGRLKYAISGSATLGLEVAEFIDALGITVYEGYGLSETTALTSANLPGPGRRRLGSVGRAIPGVRIVVDPSVGGTPEQGELVIYGPNVMLGYHHRPDDNAAALSSDGGFRTGDLGHVDDDGFLYITGRIKEQYKLDNGKYVMPSPLEEELKLSPFVANVMIYGEGRPFNVALVVIDETTVRAWAQRENVTLGADLVSDERVRALLADELALHSRGFKSFERPLDFALVAEDFTPTNGLLTPTLKLRRRDVLARHGALIEALYAHARSASPSGPGRGA
ncbi:MAG TPA: long-chain fatty acid--CoA ligase [Kofleriaceae bacterium]|nr:long-chain fatty acid--CoA ligase [Kofleriaceae bacterium]